MLDDLLIHGSPELGGFTAKILESENSKTIEAENKQKEAHIETSDAIPRNSKEPITHGINSDMEEH